MCGREVWGLLHEAGVISVTGGDGAVEVGEVPAAGQLQGDPPVHRAALGVQADRSLHCRTPLQGGVQCIALCDGVWVWP